MTLQIASSFIEKTALPIHSARGRNLVSAALMAILGEPEKSPFPEKNSGKSGNSVL
jgi:hypothetical protein